MSPRPRIAAAGEVSGSGLEISGVAGTARCAPDKDVVNLFFFGMHQQSLTASAHIVDRV